MRNWKTTLLGILAAIAMTGGQAIQNRSQGGAPLTLGNLIPAVAVAALGAAAKDHDSN